MMTGLTSSQLDGMLEASAFPMPCYASGGKPRKGSERWVDDEVISWIKARPESKFDRIQKIDRLAVSLTGNRVLSETEIVSQSTAWSQLCGIYFLIKGAQVVYVGQSIQTLSRIGQHHKENKKFDSFAFMPCRKDLLDKYESLYIHMLRPSLNGCNADGAPSAPISLEGLFSLEAAL